MPYRDLFRPIQSRKKDQFLKQIKPILIMNERMQESVAKDLYNFYSIIYISNICLSSTSRIEYDPYIIPNKKQVITQIKR